MIVSELRSYAKSKKKNKAELNLTSEAQKRRLITLNQIEDGSFPYVFADWVRERGQTEQDVKVVVEPWVYDHLLLIGDLRISFKAITGAAQVIKSLGLYLLCFYVTEVGGLSGLFTFPKSNIRDKLVGSTVKPIWDYNRKRIHNPPLVTVENNKLIKTAISTFYTSFAYNPSIDESIAVPTELSSITVDFVVNDESSQCEPALLAVLPDRMNNGKIDSRPVCRASTPGREGTGISADLNSCEKQYYPHVKCIHCDQWASLHPEKAWLKKAPVLNPNGKTVMSYYDQESRVLDWNHHDPNDKINTSYLACHHCGGEIKQHHLKEARLLEITDLTTVQELLEEINLNPWKLRRIGIHVCPFLRRTKMEIAVRFANDALNTRNPENFVQQTLGIPTTSEFSGLNTKILRQCINAPSKPEDLSQYEVIRFAGIDQARGSSYVGVADVYIPLKGSKSDRYLNSILSFADFTRVGANGLSGYIHRMGVQKGALDCAPDFSFAAAVAKAHKFIACLQKTCKEVFKENKETEANGVKMNAYDLNNQVFLTEVIQSFSRLDEHNHPMVRLPSSLKQDLLNPPLSSPIKHFLSVIYEEEKEMWVKDPNSGSRADYLYTVLFVKAAIYYYIHYNKDMSKFLKYFN